MQETWVWSLMWEDPTCLEIAKPAHRNYWVSALEPGSTAPEPQLLKSVTQSLHSATREATTMGSPQLESSPQGHKQRKPTQQ